MKSIYKKIVVEAPTRIDLAGGTIDMPPLFLFHYPAPTINFATNIKVTVTITKSPQLEINSHDQKVKAQWKDFKNLNWNDQPKLELIIRLLKSFPINENLKVEINSQAPAGSGLGASSAIAIALTTALAKWLNLNYSKAQLIEHAKSIETQTIKVPTGYQDYLAAVYGDLRSYRVNLLGEFETENLDSANFRKELEKHSLLVYTGKPHFSGANNWQMFKKHIDQDEKVVNFFEDLKQSAENMIKAIQSKNIVRVADALTADWQIRKSMIPNMSTPEIEKLTKLAMKNGALALRVCGAGGGGCAFLLVEPSQRQHLIAQIRSLNMDILPSEVSQKGVTILEQE